jgi:hypothetical protein
MKIGITGTREGANDTQLKAILEYLQQFPAGTEFHHGDCVGVDVEIAIMANELGFKTIAHPGPDCELRAHHESHEIRGGLTHFKRNRNIVDETDTLVVVPLQNEWQPRGGTWYTASYAKKKNLPYVIFYPNGTTENNS